MPVKLPQLETSARPIPQPAGGIASYRGATGAETAGGEAQMRLGQEMGAAGDQIYVAFKAEEEKTNTLRAEEAFSKLRERQLQLTYGEQDGFTHKRGSQALDRPLAKEYGDRFNQAYREIESGLGNDDQKLKFKTRATAARLQFDEGILRHLAQENDAYAKQVSDGAVKTEIAAVTANPYSTEAMLFGLERARGIIEKEVARQGLAGKAATDQVEIHMRKVQDAMWVARIEAIMYQQPMTADKLFRDNADKISDPQVRLQLQARTREAAFGVQGTMEAQKIIDEFRSIPERAPGTTDVKLGARAQELADKQFAGTATKAELNELAGLYKQMRPQGGAVDPSMVQAGGMPGTDPMTANTSGLPMARDIAAELPLMLTKVEKRADALYGTDPSNPDRAAFVRRVTQELQAKVAADVQQLNAIQRKNQGIIIDAVAGMSAPGGGMMAAGGRGTPAPVITSFAQIQADPRLYGAWQMMDVQAKVAVMNMIEANQRADQKGDEKLYWEVWNRIHLPAGDPRKIDFYGQVLPFAGPGKLSTAQIGQLRLEIDRSETPGGRSVQQMRRAADTSVERWFQTNLNTNLMFMEQKLTNPTAYMDWTNRWREEVGKKVDALIAEGKPELVRNLFMPDSKESVITPAYLQTFMTPAGGQPAVAPAAARADAGKTIAQPKEIDTREKLDAWFKTLPPDVTTFVGTDGKAYKVPRASGGQGMSRPDGTQKGAGFLGPLPVPGTNSVATEYSIGVQIGGKEVDIPTLVPTLTRQEVGQVLAAAAAGAAPPEAVVKKAREFAEQRIKEGKPVFATAEESPRAPNVAMDPAGKLVTPPAPKARDPNALPKFAGSRYAVSPEEQARLDTHFEALKAAVGAVASTVGNAVIEAGLMGIRTRQALVEMVTGLVGNTRRDTARATFQAVLDADSFMLEDVPVIEAALKYGDLDAAQKKKAKAMLKAAGKN